MSQSERYNYLIKIPRFMKEIIYCFPVSIIEWCCNCKLMNIKIIQHYLKYKEDRKYITNSYIKDCEKGITGRKVLWRKCQNVYCDEYVLQKIYQTPDDIYWGLCKKCEEFRIPHHKLMKLHLQIKRNNILY